MAEEAAAVAKLKRKARKSTLKEKLETCLSTYQNVLVCIFDNVGSNQLQKTRILLRGRATILMGKNTIARKVIRAAMESSPQLEALLPFVRGNIGFVFTNDSLTEIRKLVLEYRVPAAAKAGMTAPNDVVVPAGPTGLDPGQTSFFQTMNIPTKIVKGAVEIVNPVTVVKQGDKINSTTVAICSKLNIKPFFYGIKVTHVYENGSVYEADVLDLSQDDLMSKFVGGVRKLTAISLAIGYPTLSALPQIVGGAFKKLLAVALAAEYDFKELKELQSAAASAPAASAAPAGGDDGGGKKGGKKEEKVVEAAVEEEEDYGSGGMFD
jgi:large subunit ribosomal protein LP0